VWCDIEPEGWHMAEDALRTALGERGGRVAAVLSCSTFGTPPAPEQREGWQTLAREAGVPLLLDSAAGVGAERRDQVIAEEDMAEVFSMHATKPLGVGEGGLVLTRDDRVMASVRRLANFGLDEERIPAEVGINAKLSEVHAATALAALDRLPAVVEARRARARALLEGLSAYGARPQARAALGTFQFVPVLMPTLAERDAIVAALSRGGVEARTYFYPPMHEAPAYRDCDTAGSLGVTEDVAARIVSLPMATDLQDDEITRILACFEDAAD
jgi:dTDP-4-amino-4,6-dideoxygalactose transaminase